MSLLVWLRRSCPDGRATAQAGASTAAGRASRRTSPTPGHDVLRWTAHSGTGLRRDGRAGHAVAVHGALRARRGDARVAQSDDPAVGVVPKLSVARVAQLGPP